MQVCSRIVVKTGRERTVRSKQETVLFLAEQEKNREKSGKPIQQRFSSSMDENVVGNAR